MLADASFFPDEPVNHFNMYDHKTITVVDVFWNHTHGLLGTYRGVSQLSLIALESFHTDLSAHLDTMEELHSINGYP